MSDVQTIWQLSLALGCSVGAYWMKVAGSGVSDDKSAESSRGNSSVRWVVRPLVCTGAIHGSIGAAGGADMKGENEHRGQVIDFGPAADCIRMRRWAVANGFDRVRPEVK